ncbi:MAG: ATP-binding protein [Planctomycetes bacterium]|nr:ATP-binding protein [Planctomycetota bacterium]
MENHVEIRVAADPANLCIVRSAVQKAAEKSGLDQHSVDAVTLALEEAMANTIRHGYGGPSNKPIIVSLNMLNNDDNHNAGLEILIRDFGRQIDPSKIKGRDLDDVRPGGLGVHIIYSSMDVVEYSCPSDDGMQLRLIKYINSSNNDQTDSKSEKSRE